ncbi:MAG: hypothetical protein H6742_10230 [Alphaproteobacteria bacterium]|nr:hypothetical protein [Alphaproteobacteria bacterium]
MSRASILFAAPLLAALPAAAALSACETLGDCSTEARASVQLEVVDTLGDRIPGATATYTIEGENWPHPQDCEDLGGGDLVCGWEVDDVFHIEVSAPGYTTESVEIEVFADECHVITEQLSVELDPA